MSVLTEYNFIVVLDRSGSMIETDCVGGKSRWDYMRESVVAFSHEVAALDDDGIGLVVFGGSNIDVYDGVDSTKVKEILSSTSPRGGTPLTEALQAAFKLAAKGGKKAFIMVFTDGEPNDKRGVVLEITKQANSQETDDQCSVLFVQVGHDTRATEYLDSLDNDIKAKWDIVDAMTISEAEKFPTITALVEKAIAD